MALTHSRMVRNPNNYEAKSQFRILKILRKRLCTLCTLGALHHTFYLRRCSRVTDRGPGRGGDGLGCNPLARRAALRSICDTLVDHGEETLTQRAQHRGSMVRVDSRNSNKASYSLATQSFRMPISCEGLYGLCRYRHPAGTSSSRNLS